MAADPALKSVLRVKIGARRDGTLTTLQGELIFDAGAYTCVLVGIAAILMGSMYRWENLLLRGTEVLSHKSGTGGVPRAGGSAGSVWSREPRRRGWRRELGIDPFDLRVKNAAREGDLLADGRKWPRIGLLRVPAEGRTAVPCGARH